MSPLLWGIAAVMAVVLIANVALMAAAVWLSIHPKERRPLALEGGTRRRRRPIPHRHTHRSPRA